MQVALAPGFPDEAAYVDNLRRQADELSRQADTSDDLTHRVALRLAAANWMMARELEGPCTRRLLDVPARDADEGDCRNVLARAEKLLAEATAELNELDERQSELPDGWGAATRRQLDALRSFEAALRAYLLPPQATDEMTTMRQAASRLAPFLEAPDRAIAAAARLWQTCLRRREGDTVRALSALELALADPPPEAMPYAFFAGLLRCRLIAERGGYATALALLMQIEQRLHDWIASDPPRDQAVRTAQLLRLQVLRLWYDQMASPDLAAERSWCAERAEALMADRFGSESGWVFRLSPVIPILAPPPSVPEPSGPVEPERKPSGEESSEDDG